ncbi:MAG: hypothetical protein IKF90_09495 [Parasporobacterium sp.]|nr:hypothetical protein [Parasporobacterium sp.]
MMDNKTRIDITALEEAIGDIQAVYHILIRLDPVLTGEGEAEMNSLLARTLQVAVDDLKEVLAEALEINRERKEELAS